MGDDNDEPGDRLRNRIRGDKAENIERAIAGYEQALQVMTRQAMPVEWAQTMMNLAIAYSDRIRGDKAENIERAIAGYEQALQVMTRQAMPVEWATTMMNLATAYSDRIRGDKAENIERAIAGYEQALQVMTRQAMPVEYLQVQRAWRNFSSARVVMLSPQRMVRRSCWPPKTSTKQRRRPRRGVRCSRMWAPRRRGSPSPSAATTALQGASRPSSCWNRTGRAGCAKHWN